MFGRKKKQEGWKEDVWHIKPQPMQTVMFINEKRQLRVESFGFKYEADHFVNLLLENGYKRVQTRKALVKEKQFFTREEPFTG